MDFFPKDEVPYVKHKACTRMFTAALFKMYLTVFGDGCIISFDAPCSLEKGDSLGTDMKQSTRCIK